jgi:anti-sigma regulatory factor (Ser/Thr protein kinase)
MQSPAPKAPALRTISATYPGRAERISTVRADLRALLADCPIADDVILCASELAANAALHSDSGRPGGIFSVRTTISPGHSVRIEVEDQGGSWEPAVSNLDRHHGLDILCALASEWDIDGDQVNRTVWAVFDWSQS